MSFSSTPKYRLHKGSGQALVQIKGERVYLGRYDSPESKEKYRRLVAEFLASTQSSKSERYPVDPPRCRRSWSMS